jgi:signal transduction histidine kinase
MSGVSDTRVMGEESDPILEEQLAHLDALERRHEMLYALPEAELTGVAHTELGDTELGDTALPEEAWPEAIPDPPSPDPDLGAYLAWLETARGVLGARAARNHDELQRLDSQWVVARRHLDRLRPDEVGALVEAQARVRERIAADETVCHLLRTLGIQLAAWEAARPAPEGPLPTADVDLLRRLLDDSAEERARAARTLIGSLLEVLSTVALDMEVVQRHVQHNPGSTAEAFRGLQNRVTDVVVELRERPGADLVRAEPGESLHTALRRIVERHQSRPFADLVWSGADPQDAEVRDAATWLVQEFLAVAAATGALTAGVALDDGPAQTRLRLRADAGLAEPEMGAEPGWVLRCRARAALAGGVVAVKSAPNACELEVRFPRG